MPSKIKEPPLPDLNGPFNAEPLLELRKSKMASMPNLKVLSGINKTKVGEVREHVTTVGLSEDEHDLTFHGGPDKALHQYCVEHYPLWAQKYPQSAHLFVPGGFGENLVTKTANEHNICIGDIIKIGPSLRVEVSLPRQPCYKLNHRFQLKNFTGETYKLNRTGWYYRVLTEGDIGVGDVMKLEKRKWPGWTIAKVQHYLYVEDSVNDENLQAYKELAAMEELGNESRKHFISRLAAYETGQNGAEAKKEWNDYKVIDIQNETKNVKRIVLEAIKKIDEPEDIMGSYIRIKLTDSLTRAYSVISGNVNSFTLGIAFEATSKRGGSRYIHEKLKIGDIHSIETPTESVPFQEQASHHLFIVGGIGITAFPPMWLLLNKINYSLEINWAVRGSDDMPFKSMLEAYTDRVHIFNAEMRERMNVREIMENRKWNSQVYVCAGKGVMEEVRRVSRELGVPEKEVHYEAFQAQRGGDPFTVEVRGKGKELGTLEVGSEETLLQVLRKVGLDMDSSCEVGNCGTCNVKVCEGNVLHRGVGLEDEDEGEMGMLSCVSRGIGHILIEV